MKKNNNKTRASALLTTALILMCALPGGAQQLPSVSLSSLEPRIDRAPGLLANELQVRADERGVDVAKDKTGLAYTYQNDFGPRIVIVPRAYDYHVLRYEQSLGATLPLLGTRFQQQVAVLNAQQQAAIDVITLAQSRRERLANLRQAYVNYWSYAGQALLAEAFVRDSQSALQQAKSLQATGFWTQTEVLDLLNEVNKVTSSAQVFHSSQNATFAQIEEALGAPVAQFAPQTPDFWNACAPSKEKAMASAVHNDPQIAQDEAQMATVWQELRHVKYSSVDATAQVTVGSVTDINYRVSGYDAVASLNFSEPHHGRAAEHAERDQYQNQLRALALQEDERRNALSAAIDATLLNIRNSQTNLAQAKLNLATAQGDLRKAMVRYETIHQAPGQKFQEVQTLRSQVYAAQQAIATDTADLYLQANQLLLISPAVCK